jgi:hypothetical protein
MMRSLAVGPALGLFLRAARFDGAGEGEYRRKVLSELIVQVAGKRAPLVVADFKQAPGQDGAFFRRLREAFSEIADGLPDHGKLHRSETRQRCPVLAVRHALQCSDNLLGRCQRMRDRERCEEGDSHGHQQRDVDVIHDVLPGQRYRGVRIGDGRDGACGDVARADRPGNRRVIAKERLHSRGKPDRRRLADPLASAAERILERAHRLEPDANSRRNELHRLDGAPFRYRHERFARSVAAQQQLAPVERFQRLGHPFCGCGRGPIDAAIGVDRRPDGRCAQTQGDDDEQAGDELKHEAHAITPRLADEK